MSKSKKKKSEPKDTRRKRNIGLLDIRVNVKSFRAVGNTVEYKSAENNRFSPAFTVDIKAPERYDPVQFNERAAKWAAASLNKTLESTKRVFRIGAKRNEPWPNRESLGDMVKKAGITLTEIAECSGIQLTSVSRYFSGAITPGPEIISIIEDTVDALVKKYRL